MLRNVGASISILMVLFASLAGVPAAVHAQTSPQTANAKVFAPAMDRTVDHVAGDLLVKLKEPGALTNPVMAQMMDCFALHLSDEVMPGWYRLSTRDAGPLDVNAASAGLVSTGLVASAQPNHVYYADVTPNDQEYVAGQQWSVTQIEAEKAWDITTGSSSIVIAILDTGTATDHPDLQGKFVPGYDMINNDSNPYDDFGHGTMTAGIAAANSNNTTGIAGVSWGARIMPVKVLDHNGAGSDETLAQGIRWAVDHGAKIINASLGGGDTSAVQDDAIKYAHDHNVLMVAAAGNTPDGKPHYPAASPYVLAVGATGRSDTVTGFSSYGPYVAVAAPGVGILSTAWDNGHLTYEYGNGTSFSCPIVAGVAALVWSINPQFTADDVLGILEDSADDVGPAGFDNYTGFGRVNAFKAVQLAQRGRPPTRTPTPIPQPTGTAGPTQTAAPHQGPKIQVDTTTPAPGELLAITGVGFGPNEIVDLSLQASGNSRGLGTAQSNAQGGFAAEVALPGDLAPGGYSLVGQGGTSKLTAKVDITVTSGAGKGASVIKGTIHGVSSIGVAVQLKPSLGVSGPEQIGQVDPSGAYSFAGLSSGIYALTATAPGARPAGPFLVQVDGSAKDVKTVDITMSVARPQAFDPVPQVANTATLQWFPAVGHTLQGPFLKFWQEHGGLAIFGYPISEEFPEVSQTDGKTYTVQYFERNRFEYHPEFAGTPNEVLMGLLGIQVTQGRTFQPGAPLANTPTQAYFPQTQHTLQGPFLTYWQQHGGLAIFGYPISEPFQENGYLVQYFERNRFEYHPEFAGTPNEVLLGLLGSEVAQSNGWIAP